MVQGEGPEFKPQYHKKKRWVKINTNHLKHMKRLNFTVTREVKITLKHHSSLNNGKH
jgi:hypothetical protein